MPALEIGTIIVKTRGREALQKAVIVDIIDQNFVLITGGGMSKVKRRRVNTHHLEPLGLKLEISRGASDDDVKKAAESAKLDEEIKKRFELSL